MVELIPKSEEIPLSQKRYDICQSCEYFFKPSKQCRVCFCFMNIKTKLKNAKCPKNKW